MNKSRKFKKAFLTFLFVLVSTFLFSQTDSNPPIVTAEGEQAFCPGSPKNIVTDFNITDSDITDTGIEFFYIQISSGYQTTLDLLELTGTHPIKGEWNQLEGKLTLSSRVSGSEMLFSDLIVAVKDVIFTTTATTIEEEKKFSLTIDNANYLESTDHFYQFIPNLGITWSDAKIAAENRPLYYGRQGYLATLTSQEEADFAGKQATGTGWIGASDEETEGIWKWVTGPEAGTIFWNGNGSGSSPNGEFANWNLSGNEPNNTDGNEDYAHITHPNLNFPGKWNDLPNVSTLQPGNDYYPQGYIVEFGAPADLPLKIAASTSIYIPQITATTSAVICESGIATITATPSNGTIIWFDSLTGSTQLSPTGNSFTTPILNTSKTYYASISVDGCTSLDRTAIEVVVNQKPTITSSTGDLICSGTATLNATSSAGKINWYDSLTSTTPIFTGNTYQTSPLTTTTTYYIEANIDNCISSARTEIIAKVNNTVPDFDLVKDAYFLCTDVGSVTLETTNSLDNYSYIWKKENVIISGNSTTNNVNNPGNYTVKAVSLAGCESVEKQIIVSSSNIATITNDDVLLVEDSNNNSIQIIKNNLGIGDYEFSLDDEFGIYKDADFFEKITTGIHTLFVKDNNGCGTTSYEFSILGYPKFFTPNGDGENDVWKIDGFNSDSFTIAEISIYNRFGVLLYQMKSSSQGWDGRYQGKIVPSNTYWFRVILNDVNGRKIEKTGSIGLIRK